VTLILLERVVAILAVLGGQWEVGTIFGSSSWDRSNPNSRLACYHRQIDDAHDLVVAHNTLPCRSPVLVYNPRTGKSTLARVGDRGPRRAGIDLSRQVARRLGHNGLEKVLVVSLEPQRQTDPLLVAGSLQRPAPQARPLPLLPPLKGTQKVDTAALRRALQAEAESRRVPVEPEQVDADGPGPGGEANDEDEEDKEETAEAPASTAGVSE
jgi:rare lipoprotein A (peptidoglycan hydrolase)